MSLHNQKNIEDMNFDELRQTVSDMRAELTKYKKLLDLYLEDAENSALGKTLKLENGKLKTQIKAIAGEIATKVSNGDMESAITQNASEILTEVANIEKTLKSEIAINENKIRTYVAKTSDLSGAIEVTSTSKFRNTEKIYVIRKYDDDDTTITSETYYYYNSISEDWEQLSDGGCIYSVFEQTTDGFKMRGNVKISGDLITEGSIFGITVGTNPNQFGDGVRLNSETQRLELVLGGAVVGVWAVTLPPGGSRIRPVGGAILDISDVTATGEWNFDDATINGLKVKFG